MIDNSAGVAGIYIRMWLERFCSISPTLRSSSCFFRSEMINAAEAVSFQFFEGDTAGMNEHVDYRDLLHIKVFLRRKYPIPSKTNRLFILNHDEEEWGICVG